MSRLGVSARNHQLASSFAALQEILLQDQFAQHLAKPLAYWVLPDDRRLPLKLLNHSIGELVSTPFEELSATPGIGQKKMRSLLKLLTRATNDQPPKVTFSLNHLTEDGQRHYRIDQGGEAFNPNLVSEALWSRWTSAVRELGLGDEQLGRVAESLADMPTVIWTKRLREYENLALSQIRGLRTHGEKRVRCVMQVFHRVHAMIEKHRGSSEDALRRRLGAERILNASSWVTSQLQTSELPTPEAIRIHLADPILRQIQADCGDVVHGIAQQRLGIESAAMTVREQAQVMGVTRARVYQLLDDCHKVIEVRWPNGRAMLDRMTAEYGAYLSTRPMDATLFLAVRQLCFPDRNDIEPRTGFNGAPNFFMTQATNFT